MRDQNANLHDFIFAPEKLENRADSKAFFIGLRRLEGTG